LTALKVYSFFFKIVFLNFFFKDNVRSIALNTLFYSHSYRIPNNLAKQKAPLVYFMKSMRILFSKTKVPYNLCINEKAMYCMSNHHAESCIKYAKQLGIDPDKMNIIVRDSPYVSNLNVIDKMIILICNSFLCVYSFVVTLFIKETSKLSIIGTELTETTILLNNLLKYKTSYLYYFSAFEKDANFTALLLRSQSVYCHKIPSSNPIKNFYAKVIADKFSFTAPFQKYEYTSLQSNWSVNEFDMYPNFGFQNLTDKTIEKKGSAPENSIGIFTRGIWLRKLRGDSFLGVGEDVAETDMLDFAKEFLLKNPQIYKIHILLHPTERKTAEQYEISKKYYLDYFNGLELHFADPKMASNELFGLFDVGVASVSSVIFERLYCGYKCLLAPINIKVKLFEDENLNNMIADNKEEFFIKLNRILSVSNEDFFSMYKLKDYRLSSIQMLEV
jgi:hypothetical protein